MKTNQDGELIVDIPDSVRQFGGSEGTVEDQSFAIVVSTYHGQITGKLLEGAVATLAQKNVPENQIKVFWVPGAWELTTATQMVLDQGDFDAVLTFGCVIRGETTHDQHINTTVSNSLGRLGLDYNTPVAFGLLTCNSMQQAEDRAGGKVGNKGIEVAEAAVHMLLLRKEILESSL
ncbi:UNVERIFIED_CONTAM: hypothetical protein GTU68_026798 [Idotea baltica]|nr:hypothetical protein [Idotea baltica]